MPRAGLQQLKTIIRTGSGSIAFMVLAACNAPEADAPPAGTAMNRATTGTKTADTQLPEARPDLPKGSRAPAADPPASARTPPAPAPAAAPLQPRITPAPQQPPAEVDPPRRDRSDEDPG